VTFSGGWLTLNPTAAEELSEEDQQLKSELDMLVERLTVRIALSTFNSALVIALLTSPACPRNPMHPSTSPPSRP
jgi:hypothetical protein